MKKPKYNIGDELYYFIKEMRYKNNGTYCEIIIKKITLNDIRIVEGVGYLYIGYNIDYNEIEEERLFRDLYDLYKHLNLE